MKFIAYFIISICLLSCRQQADINKQLLEDSQQLMKNIRLQVAEDAIKQYHLSVSGGDKIEICVKAGFVMEAYNQADDQLNYLKWKGIKSCDCLKSQYPEQKVNCSWLKE